MPKPDTRAGGEEEMSETAPDHDEIRHRAKASTVEA
jgi:hypothetical protein